MSNDGRKHMSNPPRSRSKVLWRKRSELSHQQKYPGSKGPGRPRPCEAQHQEHSKEGAAHAAEPTSVSA